MFELYLVVTCQLWFKGMTRLGHINIRNEKKKLSGKCLLFILYFKRASKISLQREEFIISGTQITAGEKHTADKFLPHAQDTQHTLKLNRCNKIGFC